MKLSSPLDSRAHGITVVYQEHPNFPVGAQAKARVLEQAAGRLRFLAAGEALDLGNCLAQITGYSTAAVPGVLRGVPLIWLRGQVENAIFCEDFLHRIGFPADSPAEVAELVLKLQGADVGTRETAASASREAREIFAPASAGTAALADALAQALADSQAELGFRLVRESGRP